MDDGQHHPRPSPGRSLAGGEVDGEDEVALLEPLLRAEGEDLDDLLEDQRDGSRDSRKP